MAKTTTTIGIIGAGHIGSQIARLAVANGYNVVISNSRGPETLSALIADLGPRARAATAVDAANAGDIVVVSVPLKNYRKVPIEPLAGKIVIDTNNFYAAALTTDRQPSGTKNRRALAIAGNDNDAKTRVTRLLDQFGFDTVDAGPLKEGWRIQRDTPGYGPRRTAEELRRDLAADRNRGYRAGYAIP